MSLLHEAHTSPTHEPDRVSEMDTSLGRVRFTGKHVNIAGGWERRSWAKTTASPAFGGTIQFDIPASDLEVRGPFAIQLDLSALTETTATGGTYAYLAEGFNIIKRVTIGIAGSLDLMTIDCEALRSIPDCLLSPAERDAYEAASVPTAATATVLTIPIPSPWENRSLHLWNAGRVSVRVEMRALADSVLTDHTTYTAPVCAINDAHLIASARPVCAPEQGTINNAYKGTVFHRYLAPRVQHESIAAAGAASGTDLKLHAVGPTAWMAIQGRVASAAGLTLNALRTITSMELLDASGASISGHRALASRELLYDTMPSMGFPSGQSLETTYPYSYAYSFSRAIRKTIEEGLNLGVHPMSGRETLRLYAPSTTGATDLAIISWAYATLEMRDGVPVRVHA